jgi:hypothetical protein
VYQARLCFHIDASIDGWMNAVAEHHPILSMSVPRTMGRRFSSAHLVRPLRRNEGAVLTVTNSRRLVDELGVMDADDCDPSCSGETCEFNANAVIIRPSYKILTFRCCEAITRPSTHFFTFSLFCPSGCPSPCVAYFDLFAVVPLAARSSCPFVQRHCLHFALNANFGTLTA